MIQENNLIFVTFGSFIQFCLISNGFFVVQYMWPRLYIYFWKLSISLCRLNFLQWMFTWVFYLWFTLMIHCFSVVHGQPHFKLLLISSSVKACRSNIIRYTIKFVRNKFELDPLLWLTNPLFLLLLFLPSAFFVFNDVWPNSFSVTNLK